LLVASFCFLGFVSISHLEFSVEKQLTDSLHLFLDSLSFAYSSTSPIRCIIIEKERDLSLGKSGNAKIIDATATSGSLFLEFQFISNISYSNSNFEKGGSKNEETSSTTFSASFGLCNGREAHYSPH